MDRNKYQSFDRNDPNRRSWKDKLSAINTTSVTRNVKSAFSDATLHHHKRCEPLLDKQQKKKK